MASITDGEDPLSWFNISVWFAGVRQRARIVGTDNVAALMGVSLASVYAWTREENPVMPLGENRPKLELVLGIHPFVPLGHLGEHRDRLAG